MILLYIYVIGIIFNAGYCVGYLSNDNNPRSRSDEVWFTLTGAIGWPIVYIIWLAIMIGGKPFKS